MRKSFVYPMFYFPPDNKIKKEILKFIKTKDMQKSVILGAMMHPDVPGVGAEKRKDLVAQDKFDTIMAEFENGTLRDMYGSIVIDEAKALEIAYSEMHKSAVFIKSKYIRRTGSSGNYKYYYRDSVKRRQKVKKIKPQVEKVEEKKQLPSIKKFEKMSLSKMKDYAHDKFNTVLYNALEEHKKAWNNIMYQLDMLDHLGFKNENKVFVEFDLAAGESGKVIHKDGVAKAAYNQLMNTIIVGTKHKNSFIHEYFHHLFSNLKFSKTVSLVLLMKKTKSFLDFEQLDNLEQRVESYWSDSSEMVARFGNHLISYMMKDRETDVKLTDAPRLLYDFRFDDFKKLKADFIKTFGKKLIKSLISFIKAKINKEEKL